jgi:isoleucyl-tRNA synthetase
MAHRGQGIEDSVFLSSFPVVDERHCDNELEKKWDDLFLLRSEVNKALEIKRAERFLGNSLEAKIIIRLPEKYKALISKNIAFLPTFFIVSAVEITDQSFEGSYGSSEIEGLEIRVERAAGGKCQRCWNWSEAVGTFPEAPDVCDRCYKVVIIK